MSARRQADLRTDLLLGEDAPGFIVAASLGHRLMDARLREPKERLLQSVPLLDADQDRRWRPVLGDRHLLVRDRRRIDPLAGYIFRLRSPAVSYPIRRSISAVVAVAAVGCA